MGIELRVAIPPRSLARLCRHRLLRGKGSACLVQSVYYDTPEFDLWRQGMAVRVGNDGKALKGGSCAHADYHQRMELEVKGAGPPLDLAALAPIGTAAAFAPHVTRALLAPVFTVSFNRIIKNAKYKQPVTVKSTLDHGCIVRGDSTVPVCELALELTAGPPHALFDVALELLEHAHLVIETRSNAERGYALLCNQLPQPVKACTVDLVPDVSAIAAFNAVAAMLLGQMQANWHGALDGRDPEFLHQMRVAVRRLRSVCGAYAKVLPAAALQPHISGLKWLAHALGPARDADVFVTEIWPPLRAALSANSSRVWLDAQWAARQRTLSAKARRALASRRYQRFVLGFWRQLAADDWRAGAPAWQLAVLDGAARDFARQVIERRDGKVRGCGRTLARLDDAHLHRLRIRIKKLRYAADSFGSLFQSTAVHGMLEHVARLQDILGAINDIQVAEQQVSAALVGRRGRAVSLLRVALAAWRQAQATVLRRKLRAAWREYRRAEQFW